MKKAKPGNWNPVCPNFVTESTSLDDVFKLIGPEENEDFHAMKDDSTMEEVMVILGKFPSRSQARKNGWTGPIPSGFNMWQIGKDQFCTLNMKDIPYE